MRVQSVAQRIGRPFEPAASGKETIFAGETAHFSIGWRRFRLPTPLPQPHKAVVCGRGVGRAVGSGSKNLV